MRGNDSGIRVGLTIGALWVAVVTAAIMISTTAGGGVLKAYRVEPTPTEAGALSVPTPKARHHHPRPRVLAQPTHSPRPQTQSTNRPTQSADTPTQSIDGGHPRVQTNPTQSADPNTQSTDNPTQSAQPQPLMTPECGPTKTKKPHPKKTKDDDSAALSTPQSLSSLPPAEVLRAAVSVLFPPTSTPQQ